MRHDARRRACDLDHRLSGHDRHGGRDRVTMQVEVHDVEKLAVWRGLHGRREISELDASLERVAVRRVLPHCTEGRAVRDGNVVVAPIRRDVDAMWTIDIGGRYPRGYRA